MKKALLNLRGGLVLILRYTGKILSSLDGLCILGAIAQGKKWLAHPLLYMNILLVVSIKREGLLNVAVWPGRFLLRSTMSAKSNPDFHGYQRWRMGSSDPVLDKWPAYNDRHTLTFRTNVPVVFYSTTFRPLLLTFELLLHSLQTLLSKETLRARR